MSEARERLLRSARELFGQKGYAETGVRELADHSGCNIAMIKHYFGSKQGLLVELVKTQIGSHVDEQRAIFARPVPVDQRIEAFIDAMVGHFAQNHDLIRIIHREIQIGNASFMEELKPTVMANFAFFASMLEVAAADGKLVPGMNPRLASLLLMGMMQFYFLAMPMATRVIGPPTPEFLAELKRTIKQIYLHGVLR